MQNGVYLNRGNFSEAITLIYKNAVMALILAVICLCFQPDDILASDADQLYENAFKLILDGDYGEAYDHLDEIISLYPNATHAHLARTRMNHLERLNLPALRRRNIDRSGRIESIVFSTLYSTWLGVGSARLANADSEKAAVAGMMIGAPVGLLTSLALTRNAPLSDGQAALINFSGYWGTWQGYGLAILLDRNDDEKTMIGSAMAGGLLGLATTSALTRKINPSTGDISLINYGGLWGTGLGLLTAYISDHEDSDNLLAFSLAGGNLAAAAMTAITPKVEFSFMQASLINLSGIVGTIVAGGLVLISQPDSRDVSLGALMAGGILGLAGGYAAFGH